MKKERLATMKTFLFLCLAITLTASISGLKGYKYSGQPGFKGEKTSIPYNTQEGLWVYHEDLQGTFDERFAFKFDQKELDNTIEWCADIPSPSLNLEERKLAYGYYKYVAGSVWIRRMRFCDETEVTNIDWLEYLQGANIHPSYSYNNNKLDQLNYKKDPQFYFFPVVGISYAQANGYCEWRSRVITKKFNKTMGYREDDKEYTQFIFRLPTKQEWIECASYGIDTTKNVNLFSSLRAKMIISPKSLAFLQSLGSNLTKESLKKFNTSIQNSLVINCLNKDHSILNLETPFYVWSHAKNQFGIHHILGNVAEMVEENGIAMGGSFKDPLENCQYNSQKAYSQPADDIGFRCICDVRFPNKK